MKQTVRSPPLSARTIAPVTSSSVRLLAVFLLIADLDEDVRDGFFTPAAMAWVRFLSTSWYSTSIFWDRFL